MSSDSQGTDADEARTVLDEARSRVDQGDLAGALQVLDRLVERFDRAQDAETRSCVIWALLNRAFVRGGLEQPSEALSDYEEAISRLGVSDEEGSRSVSREQYARALGGRGYALDTLGR